MTATQTDPLHVLREYRNLAPWNLRDLAGLVGAVLDASAITPINAAARAQPSERTIRFYVTKGLVSPPEGRGTAATYSYRHFLQLLWIKLRQMEGGTLAAITKEMQDQTGDVLERRAAQVLGASLPLPDRLPLRRSEEHTSELQSRLHLVCRLLLEKKKKDTKCSYTPILPLFFFFNDTATTEIYTLSLHDALPISAAVDQAAADGGRHARGDHQGNAGSDGRRARATRGAGARGLAAPARPTSPPQIGRAHV